MRSAWACGAWYRSRPGRGRSVVQIHPTIQIVHQTPRKIPKYGYTLGRRALQLRQIIAQIHDAIHVVDIAVSGWLVAPGRSVLGDIDRLDVPQPGDVARHP